MTKLWLLVALAVGGIIAVSVRFVVAQVAKASAHLVIKKIKADPHVAHEVAADLDMQMSAKENFAEAEFRLLRTYLVEGRTMANYHILYAVDLDAYRILLFTKVSFSDFSVTVTGKSGDVRKNDFINFLVTYHHGTRRLTVHSDMFNDTNEKFLKEGFLAAIFSGRESVSTDTSELFES